MKKKTQKHIGIQINPKAPLRENFERFFGKQSLKEYFSGYTVVWGGLSRAETAEDAITDFEYLPQVSDPEQAIKITLPKTGIAKDMSGLERAERVEKGGQVAYIFDDPYIVAVPGHIDPYGNPKEF